MILSMNGLLAVAAIYVNLVQIALFLDIDTETTRTLAKHPLMRVMFLYAFGYSITPNKMACALSVALFFVFEVKNFVQEVVEDAEAVKEKLEEAGDDLVEGVSEVVS